MQLLVAASAAAHDAGIPLDDPMNLFIIASSLVTALAFWGQSARLAQRRLAC